MDLRLDGSLHEHTDTYTSGRVRVNVYSKVYTRTDGRPNGWMHGWINAKTDGRTAIGKHRNTYTRQTNWWVHKRTSAKISRREEARIESGYSIDEEFRYPFVSTTYTRKLDMIENLVIGMKITKCLLISDKSKNNIFYLKYYLQKDVDQLPRHKYALKFLSIENLLADQEGTTAPSGRNR